MRMHAIRKILALIGCASLLFSGGSLAHSPLKGSTPANNSVVTVPPAEIALEFAHETRLTKLRLIMAEKEIPLSVPAAPVSTRFTVPLPALPAGAYQVKWSTLSGDGHAMTGGFSLTVAGH